MSCVTLSDEEWKEIEICYSRGMTDQELAHEFFPNYPIDKARARIRKRRQLDGWVTPERIEAAVLRKKSISQQDSQKPVIKAEDALASKIVELLDRNSLRVSQMADKAIREVADSPPPIEGWQDALTAYKMLRLAAGVDKDGKSIQINFGAIFNAPAEAKPVLQAEVIQ